MEKRFGDKLQEQRTSQEIPPNEVQYYTGISPSLLQEVEENRTLPSKMMIEQLAAVPNLRLSYTLMQQWKALDRNLLSPLHQTPDYIRFGLSASQSVHAWQLKYHRVPDYLMLKEDRLNKR